MRAEIGDRVLDHVVAEGDQQDVAADAHVDHAVGGFRQVEQQFARQRIVGDVGIQRLAERPVITSYSIHYTKLYEASDTGVILRREGGLLRSNCRRWCTLH